MHAQHPFKKQQKPAILIASLFAVLLVAGCGGLTVTGTTPVAQAKPAASAPTVEKTNPPTVNLTVEPNPPAIMPMARPKPTAASQPKVEPSKQVIDQSNCVTALGFKMVDNTILDDLVARTPVDGIIYLGLSRMPDGKYPTDNMMNSATDTMWATITNVPVGLVLNDGTVVKADTVQDAYADAVARKGTTFGADMSIKDLPKGVVVSVDGTTVVIKYLPLEVASGDYSTLCSVLPKVLTVPAK